MQRITQTLIKWMPSGIGFGITIHALLNHEWSQAIILSLITAIASLWAKFSDGFMNTLEVAAEERGEVLATWFLRHLDEAANDVWWKINHRFQDRYFQSLIYAHRDFHTQGLNIRGPFALNLEKVFVPLRIAPESLDRIPTAILQEDNHRESFGIWDFLAGLPRQVVFRCLVVVGPPGSGKSTLLEHLALIYAQRKHRRRHRQAPDLIPVLIYLREVQDAIATEEPPTLADLISESAEIKSLNPPPNWFQQQLEQGKCLVMLDGLDEVAEANQRQQVSQWVDNQIQAYPLSPFVLTSRPHGYRTAPLEHAGTLLEVQSFNLKQVKQFLHNWYLQNEIMRRLGQDDEGVRRDAQRQANDLIHRIQSNPPLAAMATNPLLLTMIATVHCFRGALPGRRVELYAEICDMLLSRRQGSNGTNRVLTTAQKKSVLQTLAFNRMRHKTQEFTLVTGGVVIQPQLSAVAGDAIHPEQFLQHIETGSGLIVEVHPGTYRFAHKSFLEYLAAVQIRDKGQELILQREVDDPWWEETIRLYTAQSDASSLIWAALQKRTVNTLALAYDCQREALSVSDRQIVQELEDTLENGLESDDPDLFRLAAEVKLSNRLKRLLRVDDRIDIDTDLITCAEYQLFVDEKRSQGESRQPMHWQGDRFPIGMAQSPVTGMSSTDARDFCTWLTIHFSQLGDLYLEGAMAIFLGEFRFRLPHEDEIHDTPIPSGQVGYWCQTEQDASIAGIGTPQWDLWKLEFEQSLKPIYTLADHWVAELDAEQLGSGFQLAIAHAHELIAERFNQLPSLLSIDRERAFERVRDLVYSLSLESSHIQSFQAEDEENLLNLFCAYLLLVGTQWNLGAKIYEYVRQDRQLQRSVSLNHHQTQKEGNTCIQASDDALNLCLFLALLNARRQNQMPAWEGIRILREKMTR